MSEVPDEIRDLQSNVALSMLNDLLKYYIHHIKDRVNLIKTNVNHIKKSFKNYTTL